MASKNCSLRYLININIQDSSHWNRKAFFFCETVHHLALKADTFFFEFFFVNLNTHTTYALWFDMNSSLKGELDAVEKAHSVFFYSTLPYIGCNKKIEIYIKPRISMNVARTEFIQFM